MVKLGLDFLEAGDGEEALKVLKNQPEVDLVFMDVDMPVMDGLTATRKIQQMFYKKTMKKLPVVVGYSAYSS